jgi:hypothetical protein
MRAVFSLGVILAACSSDGEDDDTSALPQPAPLVEPSGACPDLSTPGEKTIMSGGQERSFQILTPKEVKPGMPLLFVWHGLGPETPDPAQIFIDGFDLEALARAKDAIIIVPRALPFDLAGFAVLLWGILDNEQPDLTLFDDLRTCTSRALDVDLGRVYSWGFSGGGLWSSFLMMHRADSLAAAAAASGGSDITVLAADYMQFKTPASDLPMLLAAGGDEDRWPSPLLTIIDFEAATDALQSGMRAAGKPVVRCTHDTGHNVPSDLWTQTKQWLFNHRFGEPSPYVDGAETLDRGCSFAP